MNRRDWLFSYQFGAILQCDSGFNQCISSHSPQTDLIRLDDGVVDDVAPQVGEDEGAGDQEVEDSYLYFTNSEGEAEHIETGNI